MSRFTYQDRDYSFGQGMLNVRSGIGITQSDLAGLLGVSRRAVGAWEAGDKYPSVSNLKRFIELAVQYKGFHAGQEAEEIRALWQASHQKVLLNEDWLNKLLNEVPTEGAVFEPMPLALEPTFISPRTDWDDAVTVTAFYGREWETSLLNEWIVDERCRVVSILGMGGIGKSTLATTIMHQLEDNFEVIVWRSLRDIATCDDLLDELFQVLAPRTLGDLALSFDRRLSLLLEQMRNNRILLVLDNLESVLEEGEKAGHLRVGYESFGQFLRRSAETEHQSCLLLTSREKVSDLVPLEGNRAPVRTLRLARLDAASSEKLLAEKGVVGTSDTYSRLVEAYAGNPLALKIVAQTVVDLFDGDITTFFEQGEVIFGGIREMLNQQFARASSLEQNILLWLAILRESTTLDELAAVMATPVNRARLLEALDALRRRSLIERGNQQGSVILQSVVLEYLTVRMISEVSEAIQSGIPSRTMIEFSIELAQAREYVREIQTRLIVMPILVRLHHAYSQPSLLEAQLLSLLNKVRAWERSPQDYAAANIVTLLRALRGDLRGLDLSGLVLRGSYLQAVDMQDSNLTHTFIRDSIFTETFDAGTAVGINSKGDTWATGSRRGEIRIWDAKGPTLRRMWFAHGDIIGVVRFSPDDRTLASTGSWDGAVKLWDVATGNLLWTAKHPSQAHTVTFSPDGAVIASNGYHPVVRLWDRHSGAELQTLVHPDSVSSVVWSPDGQLIATGGLKGDIYLWRIHQTEPPTLIRTMKGHTNCVEGLAFSPDSSGLASASWDTTVKIWDVASGQERHTLSSFKDRVICVVWSPDGRMVASGGRDQVIALWDANQGDYYATLHGHTASIFGIVFTPDSQSLLSGCEDSTLRVWDIASARCVRLLLGGASSVYDIDWSPDGSQLVSGSDMLVMVFSVADGTLGHIFPDHVGFVVGVSWSANGRWLASGEWNNTIRIWDAYSGQCIHVMHYSPESSDYFDRLAWSPDGNRLANGTYRHGVQFLDMNTKKQSWLGDDLGVWMRHVAWHPDGIRLASGGADGAIYIWDTTTNNLIQRLGSHHSSVIDIAWCPDGTLLASSSRGRDSGECFVWDVASGQQLHSMKGHPTIVYAVAWVTDGTLISADGAGVIRWWDLQTETCFRTIEAHRGAIHSLRISPDRTQLASCGNDGAIMLWDLASGEHMRTMRRDRPYERLNITAINGLTEAQKATLRTLGAIEE